MLSSSFKKVLGWLIAGSLLVGACGGQTVAYTPLTQANPIAQNAAGLTLSASPQALTADFGVTLTAYTPDTVPAEAPWAKALQTLPGQLRLAGSLFEIAAQGTAPEQLFLAVTLPAGEAAAYDLYGWDGTQWAFLPAHQRGSQLTAVVAPNVAPLPQAVAVFEASATAPVALMHVAPNQTVDEAALTVANAMLLGGVLAQADGTLGGVLPAVPVERVAAVYPVINTSADTTAELILTQPAARAVHLQQLSSFASAADYDGLVLDYGALKPELKTDWVKFVDELAVLLHAQGKLLLVQVTTPTTDYNTGGYDWRALSAVADALVLSVGDLPTVYGDGSAEALLAWAVGEVNRAQLRLRLSAASIDSSLLGGPASVSYAEAFARLGNVALDANTVAEAGQALTLTLSGDAQTLDYDPAAFAAYYTYRADANTTNTVWLVSADTLRQRLALAEKYRLGGAVLADVFQPGAPTDLLRAITDYKVQAALTAPSPDVGLVWTVKAGGGVITQATAQPGEPYVFIADVPGEYQFAAQALAGIDLGATTVNVAQAVAQAPNATPGPGVNPPSGGGTPAPTAPPSSGGGVFVPPPPIAAGIFELGGQVPGSINHPNEMKQAGMKWVKFQVRGGGADLVAAGHAAGFKVLLSVIGDKARVTDPAYWDEYAAWVGGLAASGADAIEVWNEPNIEHEWPEGQISGATYTQLLAKAYTAIKAANGGTLVVSGGPAPTGAEAAFPGKVMNDDKFLAQMAAAGAANYMDCVGTHYNEGIVSPTQTSGDPRDSFYSRYYGSMVDVYYSAFGGSRPLCFTELGYLTSEGYGPLPGFFAWAADTSVAEQAQWLAEAASLSGSNGKVRLMIIWNVDFTLYGGDPQAGFAIIRPGGGCPACATLDAVMP